MIRGRGLLAGCLVVAALAGCDHSGQSVVEAGPDPSAKEVIRAAEANGLRCRRVRSEPSPRPGHFGYDGSTRARCELNRQIGAEVRRWPTVVRAWSDFVGARNFDCRMVRESGAESPSLYAGRVVVTMRIDRDSSRSDAYAALDAFASALGIAPDYRDQELACFWRGW